MKALESKVALITGCSGGIGRETAIRFAEEGANLAICARTQSKLEETAEICRKKGAQVLAVVCDITDPHSWKIWSGRLLIISAGSTF